MCVSVKQRKTKERRTDPFRVEDSNEEELHGLLPRQVVLLWVVHGQKYTVEQNAGHDHHREGAAHDDGDEQAVDQAMFIYVETLEPV